MGPGNGVSAMFRGLRRNFCGKKSSHSVQHWIIVIFLFPKHLRLISRFYVQISRFHGRNPLDINFLKVFACGCAFSTTVSSKSKSSQQQEHRLPMPALRWWKGATCWCFTLSILGVVGEPQMISTKIHDHSGAKQKKQTLLKKI